MLFFVDLCVNLNQTLLDAPLKNLKLAVIDRLGGVEPMLHHQRLDKLAIRVSGNFYLKSYLLDRDEVDFRELSCLGAFWVVEVGCANIVC